MLCSTILTIMSVVLLEFHITLCIPIASKGMLQLRSYTDSEKDTRNAVVLRQKRSRAIGYRPSVNFLTSETGWNIAIAPKGEVYSSADSDRNSRLLLHTIHQGIVTIQGQASGRYLAFSERGLVISTPDVSSMNYFLVLPTPHHYEMLLSQQHRHQGWYLGITRSGRVFRHHPTRHSDHARTSVYTTRLRTFSFLPRPARRR